MLSGDNGILQKATDAKTSTDNAQIKERIKLAYHSALTKDITGENGKLTMPTLQEELNKEFIGKTVTITPSADNTEWTIKVDEVEEIVPAGKDTVPQVATLPSKNGTKPYLPSSSFSQLNGTDFSTGLVITDEVDEDGNSLGNEYVWIEVPSTVVDSTATGGPDYSEVSGATDYVNIATALRNYCNKDTNNSTFITITDESKDEWYSGCGIASKEDYDNLYHSMLKSIYENGGFWIGRYEAGTTVARNSGDSTTGIIPLSQIDKYPINWVSCSEAQTIATSVSNKGTHNSSLMFGIQWDLVLRHLSNKGVSTSIITGNSESWGNYNLSYSLNQDSVHGSKGACKPWGGDTALVWTTIENNFSHPESSYRGNMSTAVAYYALTTGATSRNMQKNIYDLAGNINEFTLERKPYYSSFIPSTRGGDFMDSGSISSVASVSYRNGLTTSSSSDTRI